ncbi:MAG: TPM domain-containing protein [Candidatus Aminicenantes bacterium]|nr:TPM domain-containing protein [Candidatus Aminicenantes bacterium]
MFDYRLRSGRKKATGANFSKLALVTFFVICFTITMPLAAAAERVEDVPNPLAASGQYVGDGAGVLGPAYIDLINDICVRLKQATGSELAVITVRDLGGTTVEDFAERLFKRFGIGEKGKDNGLLILFALDDRAVRIEVGYGLESVVTDAQSGRLLDEHAVPFLARDEFGRGLFAVAKAAAETVAAASGTGATLGLSADPAAWPEQPKPVPSAESSDKAAVSASADKAAGRASFVPSLILTGAVLGLTGLWVFSALGRFGRKRSKAERVKAASSGVGYLVLMWIAAPVAVIVLLATGGFVLGPLLSALSPVVATILWSKTRKGMKAHAANYRLPCASCGSAMDLIPEDMDDAQLTTEELAEEKAGGMDYELWTCPKCGAGERFAVKLGKASGCPKCKRRTLVRASATLVAATTSHGGRERVVDACKNPKCDYVKTWERSTARIGSSSSSSGRSGFSSSSSSSRSSFGGGRSGGGGASRRF